MNTTKKWYKSKGMWGAVVTILASIVAIFGYSISAEEQETFVGLIMSVVTGLSGILAFIGRKKAESKIE